MRLKFVQLWVTTMTIALSYFVVCSQSTESNDTVKPHKYSNYSLVKVHIDNDNDVKVVNSLDESIKIWLGPHIGDVAVIFVPPAVHKSTLEKLKEEGLKFEVTQENLQEDIDHEKVADLMSTKVHRALGDLGQHNLTWDSYHDVAEFNSFYNYLQLKHKDMVHVSTIGTTYEGRNITMVKICPGKCGDNPAILIDGGIHSREWVSPAATSLLIDKVIKAVKSKKRSPIKKIDWYILPLLNPDGYAYSRTTDRLWRKNRVPNKDCPPKESDKCYGVDLNRNFDYHWDHKDNGKDLYDIYSEAYHGPKPFSEKESRALRDFILKHKDQIKAYVTVHSFGQYILTPWGFTREMPKSFPKLAKVIKKAVNKMKNSSSKEYKYYHPLDMSDGELVTGNTLDWAHGAAKVPYVFALELRDKGEHGFELPAAQIIPNSDEVWIFTEVLSELVTTRELETKYQKKI